MTAKVQMEINKSTNGNKSLNLWDTMYFSKWSNIIKCTNVDCSYINFVLMGLLKLQIDRINMKCDITIRPESYDLI